MSELIKILADIGNIDLLDEPCLLEKLKKLIKSGADVHVKDKKGNNLLHLATKQWYSDLELFDILIAKGVSINEQNKKGETVLHLLLDHDNYFFDPSKRSIFNLLIEKGADVYVENKLGWTPLDHLINEFPDRG